MTPSSLDAARETLARIWSREAQLQNEPFLTQTEYLLLPVAKREAVLTRLQALRDYDAIKHPTTTDALRAAKAAGVAIARFYQLVSHWRAQGRTWLSLVPHQSLGMERQSRLAAQETAAQITTAIRAFLETEPLATTGQIISHVRRTWNGPGELPSDTALRAFHERVVRDRRPTPGSLTISGPGQPQEDDIVAERLAETLVIDHVSIKGLVAEDDGLQPTITVAIDLWSGSPIGATAVAGPPGPEGFVLALADVAHRIGSRRDSDGVEGAEHRDRKPRLVIATTFAQRWRGLVETLLERGFDVVERRDVFLQQGGPSRRLLGMQLGFLPLERRADRRDMFDPRTTAVQPVHVIREMLATEVDRVIAERVPPAAWSDAAPFELDGLAGFADLPQPDIETMPAGKRPRGRPPGDGPDLIRRLIRRMVASRGAGDIKKTTVSIDGEKVWHLSVVIADPAQRDSVFIQLAQGAMELSAKHHVPIVVDVEVDHRHGE